MTINLDHSMTAFTFIYSVVFFAVVFPASQVMKNRVARTRGVDRLRAVWYVTRYSAALEYLGVPGRLRVRLVNELRSNLADAATHERLSLVLARLGRPDVLAQRVAGTVGWPTWSRGAFVGAVALAATALAHLIALSSFTAGFESLASPGEVVHVGGPTWVTFDATMGEAGHAAAVSMTSPWVAILPLLAFVIAARVWRLWSARRRTSEVA